MTSFEVEKKFTGKKLFYFFQKVLSQQILGEGSYENE